MTFEQADRATQDAAILGRIYIRSEGRLVTPVYETDLQRDLGLTAETVRKRVQRLVIQKEWLEWVGGGGCELVTEGMMEFEEELRTWATGDRPKSLLSDIYQEGVEILKKREWARFRLLELIADLAEESSFDAAKYENVCRETELDKEETDRTIELLRQYGLTREDGGIQLEEAGETFLQEIQDGLQVLGGISEPDWEGFESEIVKVWGQKMRAGLIHEPGFSYAAGYLVVLKGDKEYFLTTRIAKVISLLHRAHRSGHPDVPTEQLMDVLGYRYPSKVRDAFKPNHMHVWNELVVSKSKGLYRLNL